MKQILVINNSKYINQKLFIKLSKFANVSFHQLNTHFNLSDYSYNDFDFIFIFVSRNVYEDATILISKMKSYEQVHFIFITRNLKIQQKSNLLDFEPVMSFDVTLISEELVYNLLSVVLNFSMLKPTNSKSQARISENIEANEPSFSVLFEAKKIVQSVHKEQSLMLRQLSSRETELYEYLIKGTKTIIIASKMGVKSSTLSSLKNRIFKKLGVRNDVELVRLAYQLDEGKYSTQNKLILSAHNKK
jgi:DNA-binding NarL/FixJ family response regulator